MIKVSKNSSEIIRVRHVKKKDIWIIRILIGCGVMCMIIFVLWFIKPEHIGYKPIYWLLTLALLFKLLKMLHEWYHYWSVSVPICPVWKTKWKVDVLTTACPGEPREMIIRTLKAMKNINYSHTNYLCDEGNDPILKKVCEELGVIHITRIEKTDAKAGNINNALQQATGDICVVLDPDHEPIPEFLDRVLPYFEDPQIGYVQCVQAYSNQAESIIAKGAAEQSYHFYGPMMMCMNSYGTVQAIGANCAFRRNALNSIGGHASGLAEDMHTAMQLQARGWKPIYIPEILTRGLVPATLSSYYKQQLKWARGCFELLFRTYPVLHKKFTFRQKIQHLTMPLFFLFGLIDFIDILVPIVSLTFAQVPWEVNLTNFALFFLPVWGLSLLIRLFAQRWLLEKHEKGFHLVGGVLRMATWWIFLVGFIYTIFKIKVPYIPTPKEDEHQNFWHLSIPNIIVLLICILAIIYGLSIDWTPYSMAMATYALLNALMLGFIVIISQQRFLLTIKNKVKNIPILNRSIEIMKISTFKVRQLAYGILRNGPVALFLGLALLFFSYDASVDNTNHAPALKQKESGGFYSGINILDKKNNFQSVDCLEMAINRTFDIVSFKQKWDLKGDVFPEKLMTDIKNRNAIPLIEWEPVLFSSDSDNDSSENEKIFLAISLGKYDDYLKQCATMLRSYADPVFINFAPEFDNPEKPWSISGNNTPEEFQKAWWHIHIFLNNLGISNITWVWSPKYTSSSNYYPGSHFVDWIGVNCLNYGDKLSDTDWYSFSDLYAPYHNSLAGFQKPIMITEFGTSYGPDQGLWLNNAFSDIKKKYPEIESIVICDSKKNILLKDKKRVNNSIYIENFSFQSSTIFETLADNFRDERFVKKPLIKSDFQFLTTGHEPYKSSFVRGTPRKFELLVNDQPFYIKGIAYNTAHDWRDGNVPLTRRQLVKDFTLIKEMGANCIRRYDYGVYDKNVLNIAEEYKLKVLYGFWFDPKVDYYRDTLRVAEYIKNIEAKVLEFKNYPAVLGWSLGNESWGLLKNTYSKPYLTKVRQHYVKLVELLAERIHKLDPTRPVFSSVEQVEHQLPGELVAFHDGAPSLDVIGINSYYKEHVTKLNTVAFQFDSIRPYLVTEFGPNGYWDSLHNKLSNGLLIEDTEIEKTEWYKEQWTKYIFGKQGYNIGGFAFTWYDKMEGSYTWFGLTDYKGRLKPSYHALKEVWTNQKTETLPQFVIKFPESILPGREYKFQAISSSAKKDKLNYEWVLLKDENFEWIDNIESFEDGTYVSIKIPEEISNYRLYLYVSDQKGNVTTASIPIQVK